MSPDDIPDDPSDDFAPDSVTDLAWQDAWLLEIYIDRTEPGHRDVVRLVVEWSDAQPRPEEPVSLIEFRDCWGLEMDLNFGVIAEEAIGAVTLEPDHPRLKRIADEFGITDVTCVRFDMSATGSVIRVFARAVCMMPDTSYVTLH